MSGWNGRHFLRTGSEFIAHILSTYLVVRLHGCHETFLPPLIVLLDLFQELDLSAGSCTLTPNISFSSEAPHAMTDRDAALLQLSPYSTAPLNHSKTNEESPSTPFRLVDLPAEIRNQIYRCVLVFPHQPIRLARTSGALTRKNLLLTNRFVYSEAMPIFLSCNTFAIAGTRTEHKWLRSLRPEGRNELRNIILTVGPTTCNHHSSLYNALSLCPRVHLILKGPPRRLARASVEGSLQNMHGFAAATSDPLPKETDLCPSHHHRGLVAWEVTLKRDHMRRIGDLLEQFREPCPGKCRIHKGREGTHTQATVHISHSETCYYCS